MESIKTAIEQKRANIQTSNTKDKGEAVVTHPVIAPPPPKEEPKVKVRCELCEEVFEVEEWQYAYQKPTAHPECEMQLMKFKRIGLDPLFWRLPKFIVDPGNQVAHQAVDEFLKEERPKRGLFLFGKAGTGKTHLAARIAQETTLETRFIKMPKLLLELRSNFNTSESWQNEKIIEKLAKIELLIIDDLGAEKMSDWVAETIYLLIDERYGNMRPTIITSNFDLEELEQRVGDRVCSRITAMCRLIKVNTKDFRKK